MSAARFLGGSACCAKCDCFRVRESELLDCWQTLALTGRSHHVAALAAPTVIIVGPPWLRTGTGRVIEAQIAYYRQRGFRVAFIAVPVHASHTPTNPIWVGHETAVGDLRADWTATTPLRRSPNPRSVFLRAEHYLRDSTALDWIVQIGRSGELSSDVVGLIDDHPPTLIHANHVYTLGFANRLRSLARGPTDIPVVVETHDIQSHVIQDDAVPNPWTLRPDSFDRLLRAEIALLRQSKVLVHLSVDDFAFFAAQIPDLPHVLAMPSIDPEFISGAISALGPAPPEPIDLLFVGAHHTANLKALEWFFNEVWPVVADRGFTLKIVGHIDNLMRRQVPHLYDRFREHFVGAVADIAPYYRAARCAIAPMVSGRGISVKTIEALAIGIPFVGTAKAFRGMPMNIVKAAGHLPFDQPEAFASAILDALNSHADTRSRDLYERLFSREAYFNSMDNVVRLAVGPAPNSSREPTMYR